MLGVKVTVSGKYGGSDTVTAVPELENASRSDCGQISVGDQAWRAGTQHDFKIQAPEVADDERDWWPVKASPRRYALRARGCDAVPKELQIECFPEQQASIQVDMEVFRKWSKEINKAWEKWGEQFFGASPVELKPELKPPAGSFAAEWGWKEDDDWRAYFLFSADIGMDPIIGASIELSLSVAKLALTAAGIPPPISSLTAKHVADIKVYAKAGCQASLKGGPRGQFYATGQRSTSGEATFASEGSVTIGLSARVGSDYVVSATAAAEGQVKVTGEVKTELDVQGLFVTPSMKLSPFTATVSVKLKAFVVYTKTDEKKWTPWKDEIPLYEGKKTKLLPLDR